MPPEKRDEKQQQVLIALGTQIQKLRRQTGISQEDFAAKAGLDRSYYGAIERGEYNVAALNLLKIADALNVEVGALFMPIADFRAMQ